MDDPVFEVEIPRSVGFPHDPHGDFGGAEKEYQRSQTQQDFQVNGFHGRFQKESPPQVWKISGSRSR